MTTLLAPSERWGLQLVKQPVERKKLACVQKLTTMNAEAERSEATEIGILQGPSHLFGEDSDDGTTGGTCMHAEAGAHGSATKAGRTEGGAAQAGADDLPTPPAASNGVGTAAGGHAEPHASEGRQQQHVALNIESLGPRAAADGYTSGRIASARPRDKAHSGQ